MWLTQAGSGVQQAALVIAVVSAAALIGLQGNGAAFLGVFPAVGLAALVLPVRLGAVVAGAAAAAVSAAWLSNGRAPIAGIVLNDFGILAFFVLSLFARRLRESNQRAELLLAELEQTRAAQAQAAALAERQRLAREMHDVLAHSLSGLVLNLEAARLLAAQGGADPQVGEAIGRANRLAKTGLEEARRAIGMLRDDALPGPERLAGLAAEFEADTGVACKVAVTGDERDLGPDGRLTLYRVAQEALTNIRKHTRAARVEIRLAYEPAGTSLTIEDFGSCRDRPARRRDRLRAHRHEGTSRTARRNTHRRAHRRRVPGRAVGAGMNRAIRVLVADDQRVVREGLGTLLGLLAGVEVVGTAADGDEALALAIRLQPDVVLMDLRMPHCDGVEATRRLRDHDASIKVLVLTTYADDRSVIEALRAGARGYLTKDSGASQIRDALERVTSGQAAIDPAVQQHLLDTIATGPSAAAAPRFPAGLTAARSRRAHADRPGTIQHRDRRPARGQRDHRQKPHQPPLRQNRRPRPSASRRLRLPARTHLNRRRNQRMSGRLTRTGGCLCRIDPAVPTGDGRAGQDADGLALPSALGPARPPVPCAGPAMVIGQAGLG